MQAEVQDCESNRVLLSSHEPISLNTTQHKPLKKAIFIILHSFGSFLIHQNQSAPFSPQLQKERKKEEKERKRREEEREKKGSAPGGKDLIEPDRPSGPRTSS